MELQLSISAIILLVSIVRLNGECFCNLSGKIDECSCNVDAVDHYNNVKVYPRLSSLLRKDYFRFFKVNLKRDCPFWEDDSKCAMKFCHVQPCEDDQIPSGLKGINTNRRTKNPQKSSCSNKNDKDDLDYLNKTISPKIKEDMALWTAYDNAQDNFCIIDENDEDAEYVDLLLNPERFTGYKGDSAHRIWNSIYLENCFRPQSLTFSLYIQNSKLDNMCLEERAYYRAISGLHSSINIHLCANYLNTGLTSLANPKGEWGPNLKEFVRRFSPETTNGEGPNWLRNLYFVYLLEMRALAKAAHYLDWEEFFTGNEKEDWDTQMAIKDLLHVIREFPYHFDESSMFSGGDEQEVEKLKLKRQFREHFRNVTQIMDCVGCEKCKLWGKLQTKGLGTALKILFSGKFEHHEKNRFQLQREEIVALFNAFGRLSTSIYKLDDFRQMLESHQEKLPIFP